MIRKMFSGAMLFGAAFLAATPAFAQEAVEAAAAVPNPGNNAWMMTATILVLLMILPGLALFYGGLTRQKNMLSTMTQIGATAALAMLVWVMWGYSACFRRPPTKARWASSSAGAAISSPAPTPAALRRPSPTK